MSDFRTNPNLHRERGKPPDGDGPGVLEKYHDGCSYLSARLTKDIGQHEYVFSIAQVANRPPDTQAGYSLQALSLPTPKGNTHNERTPNLRCVHCSLARKLGLQKKGPTPGKPLIKALLLFGCG